MLVLKRLLFEKYRKISNLKFKHVSIEVKDLFLEIGISYVSKGLIKLLEIDQLYVLYMTI